MDLICLLSATHYCRRDFIRIHWVYFQWIRWWKWEWFKDEISPLNLCKMHHLVLRSEMLWWLLECLIDILNMHVWRRDPQSARRLDLSLATAHLGVKWNLLIKLAERHLNVRILPYVCPCWVTGYSLRDTQPWLISHNV